MEKPKQCSILGVNVAVTNMSQIIKYILENIHQLKGEYITLSNVHTTVLSYENKDYRMIQNRAFLALPDGSPLSYVQRLRGFQDARQTAGPDLMDRMWQLTENTDIKHYFYGGSPEAIENLKKNLKKKYPNLKIAGMESPPFRKLTEEEDTAAVKRINESGADIVWVGLGAPKQEQWMYNHKGKVEALMFGVGAGFDFHAGTVKRAPKWMREHYLEWFYRLIQDPKRLWKRYIETNAKFVLYLLWNAFRGKEDYADDKKRMLIYAHYYYPDVASTGQILTDLAEGLKDDFYITVICTVPSYGGKITRHYRLHKYYYEDINGVEVIRVRVPEFKKNSKISRLFNITSYFFAAISATFKTGHQDYVYAMSQPPILGGMLGVIGKRIKKAKLIYNIQDFNPEQIMAVNYVKNKIILNTVMAIDKHSCKKSDKIIVVGRDMKETLKKRFSKPPKHVCINNWIDEEHIIPLGKDNKNVIELCKSFGVEGKFVLMYSGNIGLYYDLLNLIKVFEKFKDNEKIAFVFVGAGSIKDNLREYVDKHGMTNVVFVPYQDKEHLVYSLNVADVHLVVNAKGIKGVSVPSKLYGVMAAGKPVLGILEEGTEARCIVEESGCGLVASPGDYESIEELINKFANEMDIDKCSKMGLKGRKYLDDNLTKKKSIDKYKEEIFKIR